MQAAVHQIWMGGPPPDDIAELMERCRAYAKRSGAGYTLWDEQRVSELPTFGSTAPSILPRSLAADMARSEIVARYGGLYLDCDLELTRKIDYLFKLDHIITRENHGGQMTACFYGGTAGHRVGENYFRRIERYVADLAPGAMANTGITGRVLLRKTQQQTNVDWRCVCRHDDIPKRWFIVDRKNLNVVAIHYAAGTWKGKPYKVIE